MSRLPSGLGLRVAAPRVDPALRALLRPMGLLPWRELGAETTWFGGDDVIVAYDARTPWMGISARHRDALAALGGAIGVDLLSSARAPGDD